MRLKIEGPCFIDVDGPFTITPIYVSQKAKPDPMAEALSVIDPPEEPSYDNVPRETRAEDMYPLGGVQNSAEFDRLTVKAKPKRRRKGKRVQCVYCHTHFIGRSRRAKFCRDAHRHAWMRQRGYSYPLPKGQTIDSLVEDDRRTHIEAGASGLRVNGDES